MAVAAMMLMPAMADAQSSVTLADGTSTNEYVPVYGYYADAYLRSQSIYPASMLSSLTTGEGILEMTFYSTSTSVSWGDVEFEVKLGEVTDTVLSAFSSASLTTVYTGALSIDANGLMQFSLDDAYTYGGGNLMVEIDLVEPDDYYIEASFLGISRTGASWQGYSYNSVSDIGGMGFDFLPKLTIGYGTAPSCARVSDLTVGSTTQTTVSLSWTDTANSGATYSVYDMSDTTLLATSTTTSCTVTGLTAATVYTLGVRAECSASESSFFRTVAVMTACGDITVLPYTEGFESGLGCWTTVNGSADGMPWSALGQYSHTGNSAAFSFSWSNSAIHPSAWLISPMFDLSDVTDSITFSWWHLVDYSYYDEPYDVVLSTTGNDTASFTTTLIHVAPTSSDEWVLNMVDLSAYAGQQFYIAFHHHGSYDEYYLAIDDIALQTGSYTPPAPDSVTMVYAVNDATMGTITPAPGTYRYGVGDALSLVAAPAAGYALQGWSFVAIDADNDTLASSVVPYTDLSFWADVYEEEYVAAYMANLTIYVTAMFGVVSNSNTLVLSVNDATMGTTSPAPGTYDLYGGDSMTIQAIPAAGYYHVAWAFSESYMGMSFGDTLWYDDPEFSSQMPLDMTDTTDAVYGITLYLTAIFSADSTPEIPEEVFTLVCGVNNPAYGTTSPAPGTYTYTEGQAVSMVAVPNDGYHVTGWLYKVEYSGMTFIEDTIPYAVNDVLSMLSDSTVYVVDESDLGMTLTLIAILEEGEGPVTTDDVTFITEVNNSSMGTMTPAPGTYTYAVGNSVTVSFNPFSGYYLHSVQVTVSHPLYGTVQDETLVVGEDVEMEDFNEPIYFEEGMEGFVFTVKAIFAANGQEPEGIGDVDGSDVRVYSADSRVYVSGAEGRTVVLYDVNGRQLGREANAGERVEFRVAASGVYLVKVGDAAARRVAVIR